MGTTKLILLDSLLQEILLIEALVSHICKDV